MEAVPSHSFSNTADLTTISVVRAIITVFIALDDAVSAVHAGSQLA